MQVEIAPDISIDVPAASFSERVAAAWAWPDPVDPSQWAAEHRELHEGEAHAAGPWENSRAPYLRGIMDLANKPGIERIVVEKAAQIGVSEATRNLMGYWAHIDPAPMGLALPDKIRGEQIVSDRLMPLFRKTPVLRRLLTARAHDVKKQQITLANAFTIYLMWSGSPAATAANPLKRAITDEANKHAQWRGAATDPVDSVDKRLRTYTDALHLILSTPTSRYGKISREFDACPIKLYFLVACPQCGTRQRLVWPQVIVPPPEDGETRDEHAYRLVRDRLCMYRCAACEAELTEKQRRRMTLDAKWGTVGEDGLLGDGHASGGIEDAEAVERWPDGTRLGMQLGAFYCLWESVSLSTIAAEFIRAQDDPAALYTWRTETCGERWEQRHQAVKSGTFAQKVRRARLGQSVLPWWTDKVIITVDTQKEHFYAVVRAWGPGLLSQRVYHDKPTSFKQLERLMAVPWRYEDEWLPARTAHLLLIDSGGGTAAASTPGSSGGEEGDDFDSRTQEVYAWAMKHPQSVRPIKGANKSRESHELYWPAKGVYQDPSRRRRKSAKGKDVRLWMIDVHQAQNILAEMIDAEAELPDRTTGEVISIDQWALNHVEDGEYNRQMANLHQITEKVGSELVDIWIPVAAGARVDYRDCEGYQVAAAYMAGAHALPELAEWEQAQRQQQTAGRGWFNRDPRKKKRGPR